MNDDNILYRIGNTIRRLRFEKKWSQEKLAEVSGIDRSFLGKVERGEVNVSILTLCNVAKALGTHVINLL